MKRMSIRKSAFLTLCYLQTINTAPQPVTAQKGEDLGILLKISIKDKFGKQISQASFTTATAGIATKDLAFDFQHGPNSISVYNDSCGTKSKQAIGKLLVTQKDAPMGSEIVLQGTTSQIHISLKQPEKNLSKDIVLDTELKTTESSIPVTPPLILEPSPITVPNDRREARKERRRRQQKNKNPQANGDNIPVAAESVTSDAPEAPEAPPFISEPSVPTAPPAPPFITETPAKQSTTPSSAATSDSSRQALLDQIGAGKQLNTTPTRTTSVVLPQRAATQQTSSRDDLLRAIQGGTKLKKIPTQESTESAATPSRIGSGGIISDELMKQLQARRKDIEQEMEEDADVDEWD